MEQPVEAAWVATQVGWGGTNSVSQIDGDSAMVPASISRGKASAKENGFCQHFYLGERYPSSACFQETDNSVSPDKSMVPFVLPPQLWSSE